MGEDVPLRQEREDRARAKSTSADPAPVPSVRRMKRRQRLTGYKAGTRPRFKLSGGELQRTPIKRKTSLSGYKRGIVKRRSRPLRESRPRGISDSTLDALCRELVVVFRDQGVCQRCGKRALDGHRLEWSHVHNRQAKSIQWTPWNTITLCGPRVNKTSCHHWFDQGDVAGARKWWAEKYPDRAAALAAWRAQTPPKIDRQAIKLWLENQLGLRAQGRPVGK